MLSLSHLLLPDLLPAQPLACPLNSPTHPHPFKLQSDRLIVFHDRSPAATCHLQVVPIQHIADLHSLRPCAADHALGEPARVQSRHPLRCWLLA